MKKFGPFLNQLREERNISKKELANRANLSPGYISLLTRGDRTRPSLETVNALMQVLELNQEETELFLESAQHPIKQQHIPMPKVTTFHQLFQAPFVVGTPVVHPQQFFGRTRAIQEIFTVLKSIPLQHCALIGPHFSGKTSLLQYIKTIPTAPDNTLRPEQRRTQPLQAAGYRWVFVDFENIRMRQQETLLRHLLNGLSLPIPDPCDIFHFMEVFEQNPLTQPTVLLLDGLDSALPSLHTSSDLGTEFWETLRSLANSYAQGNLAFVATTTEPLTALSRQQVRYSPFFNMFGHVIETGPLTETEARQLIRSSPMEFGAKDVEWILAESQCWPVLVQCLCSERLKALEYEIGNWKEIALERTLPYRSLFEFRMKSE
jgi:transcriptional regulator with XRE-family HTH domain